MLTRVERAYLAAIAATDHDYRAAESGRVTAVSSLTKVEAMLTATVSRAGQGAPQLALIGSDWP